MRSLPPAGRRRIYGTAFIAAVVALLATGVAAYQGAFIPTVPVTLEADRAGLIMEPGARVLLRGVPVGKVEAVEAAGDGGALLRLGLDPDQVDRISTDAVARIDASTVFGPKAVALDMPAGKPASPIQAGDVLRTDRIATEVNEVFDGLHEVLTTVEPSKLNATLGAMAKALDGRGSQLGNYVQRLDGYLTKLNGALPTIRADISASADVMETYAGAANDLLKTLKHSSSVSRTLTDEQSSLHAVLLDLTRTGDNGRDLLGRVDQPLVTLLDALRPTTRLLAEYSPELTCVIKGLNGARKRLGAAIGTQSPTIQGTASVVPGQQSYQPGRDLPRLVRGLGPDCYELPHVRGDQIPAPRYLFDDGSASVYAGDDDTVTVNQSPLTIYDQLFGRQGGDR